MISAPDTWPALPGVGARCRIVLIVLMLLFALTVTVDRRAERQFDRHVVRSQ